MRISTETINNMSLNSMQNSYGDYAKIISKIASKKNFTKLSENVSDGVNVVKLKNNISDLEKYQGNIDHAVNEMNLAYESLGNVSNELSSINGLIIRAADASTTPDSAKAIAAEIKQRVNVIKDLMNTKYMDTYIFAGTYVQETPYQTDAETGNIVYKGASEKAGDRNITISENTPFRYNFTGEEIFGKQDGVNDFFSQMKDLDSLLTADNLDSDSIREKLGTLDSAVRNISLKNGIVSAQVTKLTATKEINEDTIISLTEKRSNLEDLDILKASSELANANTAMQASYILGGRVMSSVSLLDYI